MCDIKNTIDKNISNKLNESFKIKVKESIDKIKLSNKKMNEMES